MTRSHEHHAHGHEADAEAARRGEHGHGHGHGHGDGHGGPHLHGSFARDSWQGRLGHLLSDLFGSHSHDVADQIDDALEADARGRRALWLSLGVLAATALVQAGVVALSGSVALLGDTLHNVADALTAAPLLVAFSLARRRPTARFTYGFGRAEDLAGLFVVAMILLSAVLAGWQAVDRLLHPEQVTHLGAVAAAALIGFLGNEWVARYRITVGRRIGSAALVADGLHARTDGFTSLAVLVGAAGVAVGWDWADPVVGLLITVAILGVLRSALAQVGARLMDGVDAELSAQARAVLTESPRVRSVDDLRIRWVGHTLRAEADLGLDAHLTLAEGHAIAHGAETALRAAIPRLTEATIHAGPVGAHALPAEAPRPGGGPRPADGLRPGDAARPS